MKSLGKEALKAWILKGNMRKDIDNLVRKMGDDEEAFKILLKIIKEKEPVLAARGSWAARIWASLHPQKAEKYLSLVFDLIEETANDPVARNLTGMLVDFGVPSKLESRAINLCFHLLSQYKRAVAIHANAIGILAFLAKKYPEVKKETFHFIGSHPNSGKGCIQARMRNFNSKSSVHTNDQ